MRLSAVTETAKGFGYHDHLCWVYDEPGEWHSAVMEFLADGLAQGQRVCYVTSGDTAQWSEHLRDLDKPATLRRKDTTRVLQLGELYSDEIGEPARQLQAVAAAIEDALAAGFAGLRIAADDTPLVRTSAQLATFACWEHLVDRYIINQPFTGLCGYNRTELGQEVIAQLACLHPTVRGVPPPFRLHASTNGAAALRRSITQRRTRRHPPRSFPDGSTVGGSGAHRRRTGDRRVRTDLHRSPKPARAGRSCSALGRHCCAAERAPFRRSTNDRHL